MQNLSLFPELDKPLVEPQAPLDLSRSRKLFALGRKLMTGEIRIDSPDLHVIYRDKNHGLSSFTYLDEGIHYVKGGRLFYIAYQLVSAGKKILYCPELLVNEIDVPYCFSSKEKALQFLAENFMVQAGSAHPRAGVRPCAKKLYVLVTRKVSLTDETFSPLARCKFSSLCRNNWTSK